MTARGMMYDQGVFASRPAASVGNGYVYFATDTGNMYVSSGAAWTLIGSAAGVGALASTATLNAIASANATSAAVAMNAQKITGLANGSAAQDAAAYGQLTRLLSRVELTAGTNITDTAEATATSLISSGAVTFDGSLVRVTVYGLVTTSTVLGSTLTFTLFEGSTQITRLASFTNQVSLAAQVNAGMWTYYFTPSAGSHTYKFCAFTSSTTGTPALVAGSGGTGGSAPFGMTIEKVVS